MPAPATAAPPREPYALFPREIGGWSGSTQALTPGVARILGADDYLAALYSRPDEAAPVDFFLSWYASQTEGARIHSPEVCLPGAGWEVFRIEPVTVALPGTATGAVRLNRVVIQKGLERQLVYYWFQARGGQYTGDFAARFANMADSAHPRAHRRRPRAGDHPDRRRRDGASPPPTRGSGASSRRASTRSPASSPGGRHDRRERRRRRPVVSILVISYNTRAMTLDCLASVVAETTVPYELIVLDNASPDGSAAAIAAAFPPELSPCPADREPGEPRLRPGQQRRRPRGDGRLHPAPQPRHAGARPGDRPARRLRRADAGRPASGAAARSTATGR